jgi:ribonuclease P protein component
MKQGKRFRVLGLNLIVAPNACSHARLGLAVSTKYGNAVQRNRLKRCLRSAFRQHRIRDKDMDILAIPTPQLDNNHVSEQQMTACFDKLLERV